MISKMKKLLLGGKVSEKDRILEALRQTGVVHVEPAVTEQATVPSSLTEELENCKRAISELSRIECSDCEDKIETPGKPKRLISETLEHVTAIAKLKEKGMSLNRELAETSSWGTLGLKDLSYLRANGLNIVFAKGNVDLRHQIGEDIGFEIISAIGTTCLFMLVSKGEITLPEQMVEVPAPMREMDQVLEELRKLEKLESDHNHALQCIKMRFKDIEEHSLKLLNQKRFAEVESCLMSDEEIFVLTGWCPEKLTGKLEEELKAQKLAVVTQFSDATEEDNPPTYLDNPTFSSSIEPMYNFMGLTPSYNEPDTSFLFLATLIIFSGFLVADAGYGLAIILPLAFGYKKLVSLGASEKAIRLTILLSSGAVIYGFISNSWFGGSLIDMGFDSDSPNGTFLLQAICFFMGTLQLTVAHLMKMTRKKVTLSTVGDAGWILFLWGMYALICNLVAGADFVVPGSNTITLFGTTSSLTVWLFKISLTMILFFTAPSKNIFKTIGAGLGSILNNASGAFSDILSYIRLWAVGLAGGKVAGAFNDIGAMLPLYAQVPVLVLGHSLNIILCVIAILAHGVRLNLLEFSNHLELDWAGREYNPFKKINN
jgi:V/A-type H+-transporting ATPase subunit I